MRATSGFLKGLDPTVTIASKILVVSFVMFCAVWANKVGKYFESISDSLLYAVKWFYLGSVSAVVFFFYI